jgi:hypothetical protein
VSGPRQGPAGRPGGFTAAYLVSAAAALVPLFAVKYPPMVDLPQHAAAVFIWLHYGDPAHGFRELFAIDYLSPYVLGHGLARLLAEVLSVLTALKTVTALAILALPLAMAHLFRRSGGDVWGALLGFPLAYGFAFYWGFFNFLLALPVTLLFVSAGLAYAREPSGKSGFTLALLAFAVYFGHALAFGLGAPVVGLWILIFAGRDLRQGFARLWPLLPAAGMIAVWFVWQRTTNPSVDVPALWTEAPWQRLLDLPAYLVGAGRQAGPRLLGGLFVLLLPFACGRPRLGPPWVLAPLALSSLYFLALPNRVLNTWFVYPRYAVFTAVFALMVFVPWRSGRRAAAGRLLVLGFVLGWMGFLAVDFQRMDAEARRFDAVLERMEPGKRVLGLNFDPGYAFVAGMPVFGHFHMWYQAEKGGIAEYTFAVSPPQLVYYRPGKGPLAHPELSRRPQLFDDRRDGVHFDYYIVRAPVDMGPRLFRGAPVEFEVRAGDWWLYRRTGKAPG